MAFGLQDLAGEGAPCPDSQGHGGGGSAYSEELVDPQGSESIQHKTF